METEGIRINKYLSESGICSRREADRQIDMGHVTIDGRVAEMGDKVMPGQTVLYNGIPAKLEEEEILIAFNKPVGIVCTAEKREKDNVIDYINYPKRIYPIGRLDKDSEGLLLLTNQGGIVNKMMRSGNMHEKEYLVTLTRPVTDFLLRGLANGVPLADLGVTTRPCFVERMGKYEFRIILTQGYNRQIRRMCDYFGFRVKNLKRVRVMNIELGDLAVGQYRKLTPKEHRQLMQLLKDSSNAPVSGKRMIKAESEKAENIRPERSSQTSVYRAPEKRQGENKGTQYKKPLVAEKIASGQAQAKTGPVSEKPVVPKKKAVAFNPAGTLSAFELRQKAKAERKSKKEEETL